jgi:hypothetical protein
MHAFAGAPSTFFIPALAASLWLLTSKKLFTQAAHGIAVLYVSKVGIKQAELLARVIQ